MTATHLRRALPAALALLTAALTLYAYRELGGRPFAADDYQWLVHVQGLAWGELAAHAFDAGAQTHFFRPMVWLLFGAQTRAFGLEPAGWHAVSLALHLLNATLLALLVGRLCQRTKNQELKTNVLWFSVLGSWCLPFAIVALHPAPFEAVVWISGQSELLAAALLLAALHLWLPGARSTAAGALPRALLATLALCLALLAKESAVIGAGLLLLLGPPLRQGPRALRLGLFALPLAASAAYLALQQDILARNEVIRGAGYGIGPQLLLNPLRTLGLVAAPLPGTQYGDTWWLPWAGAALALLWLIDLGAAARGRGWRVGLRLGLAALLTLLPTAPFTSPPDSRYVYLPVLAVAALLGLRLVRPPRTADDRPLRAPPAPSGRWPVAGSLVSLALVMALACWSAGELAAREGRFAAASGPGGSLWRLATAECAAARPARILIVEPPLAAPHAEAIIRLACGPDVRSRVVGRDGIAGALRPNSLVVSFPGGSAQVEQRQGP